MAIFSPPQISLKQVLKDRRYKVPSYQRPFSWTIDEAHELWSDIEKNQAPYFLGILVLQKAGDSKSFDVVDGQQRLATLLLLIRSAVEVLGDEDELGKELQTDYINQKEWGEEKSDFTLTLSEKDKYNFFTLVDNKTTYSPPKLAPWESKKGRKYGSSRLSAIKEFFAGKIVSLKNVHGRSGIISFIQKVLALSFIEVLLEDDSDVYLFFETLNARGIDLTVADLLKNRVCSISDEPYVAASRIDNISDTLSEGKMNSFLLHYSMALSTGTNPPTKKALMSWYNDTIKTEKDKFLMSLEEFANIYTQFLDPKKCDSLELRQVLNYLKVLGATRCYPLLLVGYKFLVPTEFIFLCKAIETLTFRHSTIVGKDAKPLEEVYYKLSQDIKDNRPLSKILKVLSEQGKQIPDALFKEAFINYSTPNNQIGKYILIKIDDFLAKQSARVDWEGLTLEHILAAGSEWEGKSDYLERLGNKTLLSGELNKNVGRKSFKVKKEMYKDELRIILTQKLSEYQDFTLDSITKRQTDLASIATKVWDPNISTK